MSSLLNVSNDSSKPEEFSLKDIEVLVDSKEQNWFKRTHVGKLVHIPRSTARLTDDDQKTRTFLQAAGGIRSMNPPVEDTQDHDIFLSEASVLYVLNKCRKSTNKLNALADILGVKIHKNKWLLKEQESLQNIMDVFKGEEMLTKLNFDGYKIDLYFPRHELAVEYDEFGHKDRDTEYEIRLQK